MSTTTSSAIRIDPVKFSLPTVDVKGAFQHARAASNDNTRALVAEMIAKDAHDHHVFFNEKGFHNHLIHMVLADYSLGATSERLREVYKEKASEQLPIKGPRAIASDFIWDSPQCLGNQKYYQSYLHFFQGEVQTLGIKSVIEKYIFGNEAHMLVRFVSGVYHPMIHTGYGVEFNNPMMVAEGLAQTAVHRPTVNALFPEGQISARVKQICNEVESTSRRDESALEIALGFHADDKLQNLVTSKDDPKFGALLKRAELPELLLRYIDRWSLRARNPEDLSNGIADMIVFAAAAYGGAQRADKRANLDFFIMHSLTSSLFLPAYAALLEREDMVSLMLHKITVDFAYYISRGRPPIKIQQFAGLNPRSWSDLSTAAIEHNDEHVPKAIRALHQAENYDVRSEMKLRTGSTDIYRAMAELTLEGDGDWTQDGVGFEENWQNIPDLERPRGSRAKDDRHPSVI